MDPYVFEFDRRQGVFAVRFGELLSDALLREFYERAPRLVEPLEVRAGLVDFSAVRKVVLSKETIRELAYRPPILPDPTPRYIVAPSEVVYGVARMFELISPSGREQLNVVRSLVEAYDSLGIDEPSFERIS